MKINSSESYSILTVCSVTGGGSWVNLVNYYRGNGNRGLSVVKWGANNYIAMSGGTKSEIPTLTVPNFFTSYNDVPVLLVQRYENLTGGTTNDNFNYHFKVVRIEDNNVILDSMANLTAQFQNVFNAYGGPFFLGTDEFMYDYGNTYRPTNYKVGESIMYNQFLSDEETNSLIDFLVNKWSKPPI